jgi:filamentous hemagglutinin family protein
MTPNVHLALAAAVAACFSSSVFSNPTGPTVVNGIATIVPNGSTLTITNSPRAIINWQGFSIGAGETTRFLQQSAASAVLNRVTTANNPSEILGSLQSNGRVFLVNPSGILFGNGAQVDVAGLVASTLQMSDADFMAGRLRFAQQGTGAPPVTNFGRIATPDGGEVYLIAPNITQSGLIETPKGEALLVGARTVELVDPRTPNLRVEVNVPNDGFAANIGQIIARAGRAGIFAGLISQDGQISAQTAKVGERGEVLLRAHRDINSSSSSGLGAGGVGAGQSSLVDIEAGRDINYNGAMNVQHDGVLRAGRNINFDTVTPLTGTNIRAGGTLTVVAGGDIAMNSTSLGAATILDSSEMSLSAKSITQGPDSFVSAFQILRINADGNVSLTGNRNQVGAVTASIGSGGNFTMNNFRPTFTALLGINLAGGGAFTFNQEGNLSIGENIIAERQTIRATGNISLDPVIAPVTMLGRELTMQAIGSIVLQGGNILPDASANILMTGPVNLSAVGDIRLTGGTTRGSYAQLLGLTGVDLTVGGFLRLDRGPAPGTFARIETLSSTYPVSVSFPDRSSGSYFVNDVEGRVSQGQTGIFTGARRARPGQTLLLEYGQP